MLKITEIQAKSILNKSKIFNYCLNPYTGCQLGCKYCYARLFMRRYSGHQEAWGEFVDIKINAPEVLHRQLPRAKKGTVWISSVCDPYQPLEKKYKLTRECLKELLKYQFPIVIQTKSDLILRDVDLITRFENIDVGFTITTDDERIRQIFEPGASSITSRIKALSEIHSKGIRTFAFLGPLLPGNPENLARKIEDHVNKVYIDKMNYPRTMTSFYKAINLQKALQCSFFKDYKEKIISQLQKKGILYEAIF